ncbi:MAG: hypothetical protein HYV90_03675 [Candidatus Woesebacteria bacterium]|nr:MAG: hypothetical protein HYV90_03675 [Candidatus Woesebacteria bacterium]
MNKERPGCLNFLGPLANLFAVRDDRTKLDTRMVRSESGIEVELDSDQPDDFAEGIATSFLKGKPTVTYFDEATGKFIVKELD